MGAKKRPHYRVVVADQRSPRDGRFIENIGKYHPLEEPSLIEIDEERALHWLSVGAQPSQAVQVLMTKAGIWEKFDPDHAKKAAAVDSAKATKMAKKEVAAPKPKAEETTEPPAAQVPAEAPAES